MPKKQNYTYINHYAEENYDRVVLILPKGCKKQIQEMAKSAGRTMSEFLCSYLPASITDGWERKNKKQFTPETVEE